MSLDDPRVAAYRLLAQPDRLAAEGLFVAEGRLLLERLAAAADRFPAHSVLLTPAALDALAATVAALPDLTPVYVASRVLMSAIAGFPIHRGCLALARRPVVRPASELDLRPIRRAVLLEGVNNPDNVGGIFRTAAAFAVDAVLLGPACGDPLYRKAVRTSMGAVLHVPFAAAGEWPSAVSRLRSLGFRTIALTPRADARPLDDCPREPGRLALLLGAEGSGLSAAALAAADERVRIPIAGAVDSLNVTVAAAIALHYFAPQDGLS